MKFTATNRPPLTPTSRRSGSYIDVNVKLLLLRRNVHHHWRTTMTKWQSSCIEWPMHMEAWEIMIKCKNLCNKLNPFTIKARSNDDYTIAAFNTTTTRKRDAKTSHSILYLIRILYISEAPFYATKSLWYCMMMNNRDTFRPCTHGSKKLSLVELVD